jgi:aquaporin Z
MNKFLLEFAGALFLVFVMIATGNAIAVGAALAFLLLIAESLAPGAASGGFNPAVTIAMAAAGKVGVHDIVPLCAAQVLGGLVAVQVFKHVQI